jgi:glycosyltransferase involved in cell wall biosynthesis
MRDPALRQRVGRAARERARDQFSPEAFRAQIIDLLREAAGDPAQLAA